MKSLLCLLALCTSTALDQSSRISLELGSATVWLGMEKPTAKQKIETAGLLFSDDKPSPNGSVIAVDQQAKRIYTLAFENNKLVFADRNWLQDESAALPSVMDALSSLIEKGAEKCTISHA